MAEHATRLGNDTGPTGVGQIRVLESVDERYSEAMREDLLDRLQTAYGYFSHIWGNTVTVGVLEAHDESWGDPAACVGPRNFMVYIDADQWLSNRTLFHELAHLEIYARERDTLVADVGQEGGD